MARSSVKDPLDKFRFRVTVVSVDLSIDGVLSTVGGLSSGGTFASNNFAILTRAGFNQIAPLPKPEVKVMTYRENLDNTRSIKVPGLATYNDITLSRGSVTSNRDLYDWFRLVNDELALLVVANELLADANFIPTQSNNYRKDVIIEVLDREGEPQKAYYLFNAWPNSYTPGNSLNAQSEEKLIEELTLSYESFLELEGGPEGLAKELAKGLANLAAGAAIDAVSGNIPGFGSGGGGPTGSGSGGLSGGIL
jgi:phage tail-like protein